MQREQLLLFLKDIGESIYERKWEWTLFVDPFNHEILAHLATPIPGGTKPYYHCLEKLKLLTGKK